MNQEQLLNFVIAAHKHGYASGQAAPNKKEPDGSTTIEYESGDWKHHDNFFGGEPYGGREVIFYQGKAVWMMVYYGWVHDPAADVGKIFGVLQGALSLVSQEAPFRGAKHYEQDGFRYQNEWQGDIARFRGNETIYQDTKAIYSATYLGGLVDQRAG
jgi:hypothetical protein